MNSNSSSHITLSTRCFLYIQKLVWMSVCLGNCLKRQMAECAFRGEVRPLESYNVHLLYLYISTICVHGYRDCTLTGYELVFGHTSYILPPQLNSHGCGRRKIILLCIKVSSTQVSSTQVFVLSTNAPSRHMFSITVKEPYTHAAACTCSSYLWLVTLANSSHWNDTMVELFRPLPYRSVPLEKTSCLSPFSTTPENPCMELVSQARSQMAA